MNILALQWLAGQPVQRQLELSLRGKVYNSKATFQCDSKRRSQTRIPGPILELLPAAAPSDAIDLNAPILWSAVHHVPLSFSNDDGELITAIAVVPTVRAFATLPSSTLSTLRPIPDRWWKVTAPLLGPFLHPEIHLQYSTFIRLSVQCPLGVCGVVLVREGEERPARPKVHICQLPILSKESINVGLSEIMGQPTNPQLVRHMLG
jgi:hypothetical protein|mmetsp:Transcript_36376/g.60771  ORF Transcript_36376/g.60771 Transcript_36376/m.60771 type:complete len:206 (-) Transcript_36376:155-772(-)